ncbi:hypothetical protein ACFLZK_01775 [Patescibacteria group bacterium]
MNAHTTASTEKSFLFQLFEHIWENITYLNTYHTSNREAEWKDVLEFGTKAYEDGYRWVAIYSGNTWVKNEMYTGSITFIKASSPKVRVIAQLYLKKKDGSVEAKTERAKDNVLKLMLWLFAYRLDIEKRMSLEDLLASSSENGLKKLKVIS